MLYDTTYYANVKPRRGVRRLPTAGRGCGIRKRRRSLGAPCWSTATAGWSVPPGDRSARSVLLRKTPRQKAGLKGYERSSHAGKIAPGQRITYCAHFVARRSFLLKRRQAFQQALLQRAAKPYFIPFTGTHFRKRFWLSAQSANSAAILKTAPNGLRSYHRVGQTLLAKSPPAGIPAWVPSQCHSSRFPR